MCRLRHRELLDAAHIVADTDDTGDPVVQNGLSLCKIHHAAFDGHYLSIDPADYRIHVRRDLLEEEDGPMLRHGLQELHRIPIELPRKTVDRPDPTRLERHWDRFQSAG
jgi:putative restriction endonuclease